MNAHQMGLMAIGFGVLGVIAYGIGLWRRWRPGKSGRPAFTESATRVREPWTIIAVLLLLGAAALRFLARNSV